MCFAARLFPNVSLLMCDPSKAGGKEGRKGYEHGLGDIVFYCGEGGRLCAWHRCQGNNDRGGGVLCQRPVNMFRFSVIICIQKMCYIRFFGECVCEHTITWCWLRVLALLKVNVYLFIVI